MPSMRATFDAAKHFGLTDDEAWETVEELFDDREELAAALAARILAKQRASGPSRTAGRAPAPRTG
jgi:hypothetical protein